MIRKIVFVLFMCIFTLALVPNATAQCSMCSVNAEMSVKNGNTQGAGLNTGILYLLAIPYLLFTGVGALWYLKYRKKNTTKIA